ncbi:MAG: hypothetical protein IJG47_07715 [Microbacterium sp.]|nr:hypothetical protein [Microbacterium sp.]
MIAAGISGCGGPVSDEQLFDRAKQVSFSFRAAIAEVQVELLDGKWEITGYGDAARRCGDGYAFDLRRDTPPYFRLTDSASTSADLAAAWLNENGWTDIRLQRYDGEIADVVVHARKVDAEVESLSIDFKPDPDSYDIITIIATSTCSPGDWTTITDLARPGYPADRANLETAPAAEHPSAPQSFGYTPDGKRRFWDESE